MEAYLNSFKIPDDLLSKEEVAATYLVLGIELLGLVLTRQWKPVLGGVLSHSAAYFALPDKVKGISNVYSFISGSFLSQGEYMYGGAAVGLSGYMMTQDKYPALTHGAHAADTALGFFIDRLGWLK